MNKVIEIPIYDWRVLLTFAVAIGIGWAIAHYQTRNLNR